MKKRLLLMFLLLTLLFTACNNADVIENTTPTATATITATPIITPTVKPTPTPTFSPVPTITNQVTPKPTPTAVPQREEAPEKLIDRSKVVNWFEVKSAPTNDADAILKLAKEQAQAKIDGAIKMLKENKFTDIYVSIDLYDNSIDRIAEYSGKNNPIEYALLEGKLSEETKNLWIQNIIKQNLTVAEQNEKENLQNTDMISGPVSFMTFYGKDSTGNYYHLFSVHQMSYDPYLSPKRFNVYINTVKTYGPEFINKDGAKIKNYCNPSIQLTTTDTDKAYEYLDIYKKITEDALNQHGLHYANEQSEDIGKMDWYIAFE